MIARRWWISKIVWVTFVSALLLDPACVGSPAWAQVDADDGAGESALKPNPLVDGGLLLQADNVIYDTVNEVVSATGGVEIFYEERTLLADEIIYDQKTDNVVARGNVSLMEPSGEVFFANEAVLTDQLRQGVIDGFGALLDQNVTIAAEKAYRSDDGERHELTRAVYSACDVCDSEGNAKTPLWRIKSFRVIHDREEREIIMRDVYFELFGMPVLYLPYLSHPDPTVKRKTGFLSPSFGNSDLLGTFFEIPYFINLAPTYDLTLSPLIATNEGGVLKGNWRQKLRKGSYSFTGSVGYVDQRNIRNIETGSKTLRGHIFGNGRFKLDETWSTGFDLQWVSNDTYLQRFGLHNDKDLESHIFLFGADGRNYANINAYYFQGLRTKDVAGQTPFVFPLVDAHYVYEPGNFGRINFDVNAMILQRTDGADSRRLSMSSDWQRSVTTGNGQVITPFANMRGDMYSTSDQNPAHLPGLPDNSEVIFRGLPTVGIDWRWPFVRNGRNVQFVVEPIAQAILSTNGGNPIDIPNEDSQSFEFDTTNLFSINRFPGLDRWENGQRVNVGVRLAAKRNNGGSATMILGRSFRVQDDSPFPLQSGLSDSNSDYVGSLTLAPNGNFSLTHRFRADGQDFSIRRNEVGAHLKLGRFNVRGGYLKTDPLGTGTGIGVREEAILSGGVRINENWRLSGTTRRDLILNEARSSSANLTYQNECGTFTLSWVRRNTTNQDITPADAILFTFTLKTLAENATFGGQ